MKTQSHIEERCVLVNLFNHHHRVIVSSSLRLPTYQSPNSEVLISQFSLS